MALIYRAGPFLTVYKWRQDDRLWENKSVSKNNNNKRLNNIIAAQFQNKGSAHPKTGHHQICTDLIITQPM